jgi:hypothetical protein
VPDAVLLYLAAIRDPRDETIAALQDALADDVVVAGMVGGGTGREAVSAALAAPPGGGMWTRAEWTDPEPIEGGVSVRATLPPGAMLAGMSFVITLDDSGRVSRVEQQMIPAPPPPVTELVLTEAMKDDVNGALLNGTPVVVAYVDENGAPHVSLRGSTQAYSDTQLAMWIRDPEGGLLKAIVTNPQLALFYRDPKTRHTHQFAGRAHREDDEAVRDIVYANTPEPERNLDLGRRGAAVVVDLDRSEGMGADGRYRMQRG